MDKVLLFAKACRLTDGEKAAILDIRNLSLGPFGWRMTPVLTAKILRFLEKDFRKSYSWTRCFSSPKPAGSPMVRKQP
jgi:hypothetical protein